MAGEITSRQDLDISTGKGIGVGPTQTPATAEPAGGGDSKPVEGAGAGTGKDPGGESSVEKGEGEPEKDDVDPETGKPLTAEQWRDKFRHSAKGAQDLLTQVKALETERETGKAAIAKFEKDMAELRQIAEGKNPEGLSARDLQARYDQTAKDLAELKEERELDKFEKVVPLAASKREALRNLARANPKADLQKLWDENLKAGAEAEAAAAKAKKDAQAKGASEKGKGTSTREPAAGGDTIKGLKGDTGLTLEAFNKLPVGERRAMMEKFDIR